MALVKGIHHICLKCVTPEDYDRVMAFYTGTLELPVVRSWPNGFMLDTGSGIIEVFLDGREPLTQGVIRHVALAVQDTDVCVRAVTAAGYTVFDGPRDICIPSDPPFPARIAFCHGPLGEEIEFFQEK